MATATVERLRAIPLEVGSRHWMVENVDEGSNYSVDAVKGECSCPDWQFRCRHRREDCKHLLEVRTVIERQRHYREKKPTVTARAIEEATGVKTLPVIPELSQDELKAIFA